MIDDEADNASINTNPEEDKSTRINELIRDILRLFHKSGYVGYTATPFANIFIPIEEDQIFPRDFIINIPAPSNYIGPDKVFGIKPLEDDELSDTVLPIISQVNDFEPFIPTGHKKNGILPDDIPDSLKLAIKSFILTCAIRRLRGQCNVHNTMLVHVSRYINWQSHIKQLVEGVFDFYRRGIEFKISNIIEELRIAFEVDSNNYKSFVTTSNLILDSELRNIDSEIQTHTWKEVLPHLYDAASKIIVKDVNGGSADVLNYYDHRNIGMSVIAIGGDKLSRGLTLEGLSISYYLRASRMYDTLMQMGRWFGYRTGYVDLCRLFTSRLLNEWFCHITLASEELREEFNYMSNVAGSTPEQYALKVRTHPGVLQISASNKIRRATEINISWAGRLVETYQLSVKEISITENINNINKLVTSLKKVSIESKTQNSFIWKNIDVDLVNTFLLSFKIPDSLQKVNPSHLVDFISASNKSGELKTWNIAIMSKSDGEKYNLNEDTIEDINIVLDNIDLWIKNYNSEKKMSMNVELSYNLKELVKEFEELLKN